MKKTFLTVCILISIIASKKATAQETSIKQDTVYYLLDTANVPVKDRMFNMDTDDKFKAYGLLCKCYPGETNPVFTYPLAWAGKTIDKADLKKINTIAIPQLANIAHQYAKDNIKKTIFYFIEPEGEKMKINQVYLLPSTKPIKMW